MNRGDIYFVDLDPVFGHEQRGRRPVLILTPSAYNLLTNTPMIAAITNGGAFAVRNSLAVPLPPRGLKTTGIVRCDQVRSMDLRARNAFFVESTPAGFINEVLEQFVSLLVNRNN